MAGADHFASLHALTRELSEVDEAPPVAKVVCAHLVATLSLKGAALMLAHVEGDAECIGAAGQASIGEGEHLAAEDNSLIARALRLRLTRFEDGQAMVILQTQGQVHGGLWLVTARALDPGSRVYCEAVAELCGQALERARLADAEKRVRAEAYRVYSQLEALAQAGELMASSRDVDVTVRTLVSLALPEFADGCVFEAIDENLPALEIAHADPDQIECIREALAMGRLQQAPAVAEIVELATAKMIDENVFRKAARSDEHLQRLMRVKMRSTIVVPLVEREQTLAILCFIRTDRLYDENDVPFAHELTRRLSAALENARLYEEAQRAIQLRDDFISIAAHELKTPLAALRMRLRMLVSKSEGLPILASAERCETYAGDLNDLVNQLLDTTRIAAGQLRLDIERLDVSLLVRDVVLRFTDLAAQEQVPLVVDVPDTLVGDFDRLKMELVVSNLVSNAIKYGAGSEVRVFMRRQAEECVIEVSDKGPGIEAAEQTRLFRRFHRGAARSVGGGFGLGLWIVKHVSEAQGGSIILQSEPGAGARFVVRLPLPKDLVLLA